MTNWSGVFPAVTTKLQKDESVDLEWTQKSIERLIANGVSGIIVLPMLGENASLAMSERERVIRAAKEAVAGRVPLLSGLAEVSAASAAASARRYEALGAEGLMAFPVDRLQERSARDGGLVQGPGGGLRPADHDLQQPDRLRRRRDAEHPRELADTASIVCVKEECGDIRRVTDIFNACGDRFLVFCGVDDLILESVALGATGWVSGMTNAWPGECVKLFDLCVAGRLEEARKLYRIMTPAFHLDTHVKLVQYIKLAEHLVYGAPEWVRAPRLPLEANERQRIAAVIEETKRGLEHIRQTELAV